MFQFNRMKLNLLLVLLSFCGNATSAQPGADDTALGLLMSRLDPGREYFQELVASADMKATGERLWKYFKSGRPVRHPVDRFQKQDMLHRAASESDRQQADDALRHVFVGQPAYPPHFCGEDIDWSSNPVSDREWIWQLHRMYFWNAMARTYWHTGDEKYAVEWCRQLLDWTRKNPNDDQHPYAWRSIEAGIRGYSWTGLFQYFMDSPAFTPEILVAFLNSCFDHADFLMTQYRTGSNWGLMEAEGLAFIAITFPEFKDAGQWRSEAFRRLNHEINIQVYPDGHQRELAIGYHLGCIQWFWRTFELAEMNGYDNAFPESYLKTIEKMCEVPMKIGLPDGTNVQFGDAWAGTPGQHNDKFKDWSTRFRRDDFLYLATGGEQGKKPTTTAHALEHSGLYSMRSGWNRDDICLVLKCGPDGGGHCQPDNGTFDLYAGGVNLMPDAGSYIYSGDPENRAWFRQTRVHQTLTLNGQNSQYTPRLLLWQPDTDLDVLVVENGSYSGLTHRRAVFFVDKKFFVIVDEASGPETGEVDIHFQLARGNASFDYENLAVKSENEDPWQVYIRTEPARGLLLEEEFGQVSFEYTIKHPRPAFRYRQIKEADEAVVRFTTLVIPFEGVVPDYALDIAEDHPGRSTLRIDIRGKDYKRQIGYDLDRQQVFNQ
jgi:heparan-sulfate lyase